jgi:hypothetical protein
VCGSDFVLKFVLLITTFNADGESAEGDGAGGGDGRLGGALAQL